MRIGTKKSVLIAMLMSIWLTGMCRVKSAECDVTSREIEAGSGYLATTTEVLTSRAYWKYVANRSPLAMLLVADINDNQLIQQAELTNKNAGKTPWLLSADAAKMINLADPKHRDWAIQWWKSGKTFLPPGNGQADIKQVRQAIRNRHKMTAVNIEK